MEKSFQVSSQQVAEKEAEFKQERHQYALQRKNSSAQKMQHQIDTAVEDSTDRRKHKQHLKYNQILNETDHDIEYEEESDDDFIYDRELFINHSKSAEVFNKYIYMKRRSRKRTFWVEYNKATEEIDPVRLVWGKGKDKHVEFAGEFEKIYLVAYGCYSPTFVKHENKVDPKRVFSVCTKCSKSGGKILDLEASSVEVAELWVTGLRDLINQTDEKADELSQNLKNNPPQVARKQGTPPAWYQKLPREEKNQIKTIIGEAKFTTKALENEIVDHCGCTEKDAQNLLTWWFRRFPRTTISHESVISRQKELFLLKRRAVWRDLKKEGYNCRSMNWSDDQMYENVTKRDLHWKQWKEWIKKEATRILDNLGEQPVKKDPKNKTDDCATQ